MREIIINKNDEGLRLDKYLLRYLSKAPSSFVFKTLRKKNVKLNDVKASGKEILNEGDIIKLFLGEDTINEFRKDNNAKEVKEAQNYIFNLDIVYQDENIMVVNKPAGILSQKSKDDDFSVNEMCRSYLLQNGLLSNDANGFKPSICNRLDRNTEGLIIFAKTYNAANVISLLLRERIIHKFYYCIIKGSINNEITIDGFLYKDELSNKVTISDKKINDKYESIKTRIIPVIKGKSVSLLEIELITGKSHQIRAHLASLGHPIIGDYKYGDRKTNDSYKKRYGISHQMLLSHKIVFPKMNDNLKNLSKKVINIDIPQLYKDVLNGNLE